MVNTEYTVDFLTAWMDTVLVRVRVFWCHKGYTISYPNPDQKISTCQVDGTWDPPKPTCHRSKQQL